MSTPRKVTRCAFWLGSILLIRGEVAQANAWMVRGQRLVEGCDCVEQGYLHSLIADQQLGEGKIDQAETTAAAAVAIGDRFADADLTACARHLQGRARIQRGQIMAGFGLLDETMLAVVAGELSPIMTGLLYCSVIAVCRDVYALSRAREWTVALSRWCDQQSEMVAFTSTCLVNRAEIMQLHGAWPDAMAEVCRARDRAQQHKRKPPAAALYRQGEIHRLRGEFAQAEEAYRSASLLGLEPQPGLALLRMTQGRTDAACAAIRRLVEATTDRLQRVRLLPAYLDIMLAAGELQDARHACPEIQALAEMFETDALRAIAATLGVSERTVDRHVSNILGKLHVPSRAAATARAYDRKLL